jgi:hypothetical protein
MVIVDLDQLSGEFKLIVREGGPQTKATHGGD